MKHAIIRNRGWLFLPSRAISTFLFLVYMCTQQCVVHSKVAGLDFGGEYFKVALVKPGKPFEIVTNVHSKRKTETMVAFDGEERLYGADADTIGVRRPHTGYAQIRRFLGSSLDQYGIVSLILEEYYPYSLSTNEKRGSIHIKHEDEKHYHAEEVVAMVFSHVRQITDVFAETDVKDYVITVPEYYTQAQRQAVLDAAELAGLRVLSLINENTAAALQLCIHTTLEPDTPKRVIFYNQGSTSLQVTIAELFSYVVPVGSSSNKTIIGFKVLSKAWNQHLGSSQIDLRLAEHFAREFNEKVLHNKQDVRSLPKVMAKLRAQAKKTKIVLSANEEIPVVMQSLLEDYDLRTTVTRTLLEELCKDLFDQALGPVHEALEKANLTRQDIHEVELIGGGVRVPKVQRLLKEFFNVPELGAHLNGDEAMALGAAFRAANLSNSFRVRPIQMTDTASYGIGATLADVNAEDGKDSSWTKHAPLFTTAHRLGARKAVSLTHTRDMFCTFRYDQSVALPEGVSVFIGRYSISGIEAFYEQHLEKYLGDPKVTLTFLLDSSGIVSIAKAEVSLEEEYQIEVEVPVKKETSTATEDAAEKPKDEADLTEKAEDAETVEKAEKVEEEKVEKVMETRKRTIRSALKVELVEERLGEKRKIGMSILPMSASQKIASVEMLREMDSADNKRKADLDAKNRLEAFVYSARDTLESDDEVIRQVTLPEQVTTVLAQLEAAEEWLYEDGDKAEASEYDAKRSDMKTKLDEILFRVSEKTDFPNAIEDAKRLALSMKAKLSDYAETRPWINEQEQSDARARVEELETYVEDAMAKQKEHPPHETPLFTSANVKKQMQQVKKLIDKLAKKQKPKPVKEANATESASKDGEQVESETEIKTESEMETEIKTESEMETEIKTENETEMETHSETESENESKTEENADGHEDL
uniref:Protein heat shock protein putative n=1 Tax=Albugo laibachii Nc14 TaxID=890382 RepID=F0WJR8_9STRA|nr:protein heat shock protein putative [Albugo laibachii Nc14]|eukprot:CCA21519.1 protein heat shock protein putative [Albugo laibachii Nc14]